MSNVIGKDKNVEDTISNAKMILDRVGFRLNEESIINPAEGIWSVHLKDADSQFYTNGKGATKECALASAYCEFIERLGMGFFFDDYAVDGFNIDDSWTFSPDEVIVCQNDDFKSILLNDELWDFYDPEKILSFDNFIDSGRCKEDSIIAYPFTKLNSSNKVLFPVELLKNIYASNGLSAGNTEKEALVQGLSECIERGVKNHIIREGLSLPTIDNKTLDRMGFLKTIEDIESHGYPVIVKDASIGGRFPVICALLINRAEGTVLSSFGCHPNTHVAIDRTLTELLQGRRLESLDGFSDIVHDIAQAADESNIESHFINSSGVLYSGILKEPEEKHQLWDFDGDRECEFEYLKDILSSEGYDCYYRTYDLGSIWVTQSIVPGLSEIYPVEDLEWDNRNRAGALRDFLKYDSLDDDLVKKALLWFDNGYLNGHEPVMAYLGISASESDPLSDFTIDELEILVLLSAGEIEAVKNRVDELELSYIDQKRAGFWRVLRSYYSENKLDLKYIYGDDNFRYLNEFISGSIPRDVFPVLGDDFSFISKHSQVKGVYSKYKKLKK